MMRACWLFCARITGRDQFPREIEEYVNTDVLDYFCNGELIYHIKGVPVHLRELWYLEEPPGGKDTHRSLIKGTCSDLMIRQLPEKVIRIAVVPSDEIWQTITVTCFCTVRGTMTV